MALSSGEAEVHSGVGVRGLARLIGAPNVLMEMRSECRCDPMEHAVDGSTCKSVLLSWTKQLWVQEGLTKKSIPSIEDQPRGESRRHTGVVLKRQGHAEARQDDGLPVLLTLHLLKVPSLVLPPSWAWLTKHILGLSHFSEVMRSARRVASFNLESTRS